MSTGLAASTVTPGSTAPDVSLTTPERAAWAKAAVGPATRQATTSPILTNKRILNLTALDLESGLDRAAHTSARRTLVRPSVLCKWRTTPDAAEVPCLR